MGPRRILATLAALALVSVATAGVAAASSSTWSSSYGDGHGDAWGPDPSGGFPARPSDATYGPHADGHTQEGPPSGGGVDAAGMLGSVTSPLAAAPAAAVNGPAPAAAAAAVIPALRALTDAVKAADVRGPVLRSDLPAAPERAADAVPVAVVVAPAAAALPAVPAPPAPPVPPAPFAPSSPPVVPVGPAPPAAPIVMASDPYSFAGLPHLGSLGQIAASVSDGPATARALLATRTGRSVAVLLGFVLAILLFLSIHRRFDRGDRKLATARSVGDVARFR